MAEGYRHGHICICKRASGYSVGLRLRETSMHKERLIEEHYRNPDKENRVLNKANGVERSG